MTTHKDWNSWRKNISNSKKKYWIEKDKKQHLLEEIEKLRVQVYINRQLMEVVNSAEEYDKLKLEIEDYVRKMALFLHEYQYGSKLPDRRVCSLKDVCSTSHKTKCYKCKRECYFDSSLDIKMSDNCKNICSQCALKMKGITKLQREILESIKK